MHSDMADIRSIGCHESRHAPKVIVVIGQDNGTIGHVNGHYSSSTNCHIGCLCHANASAISVRMNIKVTCDAEPICAASVPEGQGIVIGEQHVAHDRTIEGIHIVLVEGTILSIQRVVRGPTQRKFVGDDRLILSYCASDSG